MPPFILLVSAKLTPRTAWWWGGRQADYQRKQEEHGQQSFFSFSPSTQQPNFISSKQNHSTSRLFSLGNLHAFTQPGRGEPTAPPASAWGGGSAGRTGQDSLGEVDHFLQTVQPFFLFYRLTCTRVRVKHPHGVYSPRSIPQQNEPS